MKHFTLMISALLLAGSAQAQSHFTHKAFKPGKAQTVKTAKQLRKAARTQQKATPLYKAQSEEEWGYEDGEWVLYSTTSLTFDQQGNELTVLNEEDGSRELTTSEYNADNLWTSQTTQYSEEGAPFENSSKRTRAFDPIVKNLVVESADYDWQEGAWTLANKGQTWKREVVRNADNNITGISVKTLYMGDYEDSHRITITYNDKGQASTWKYEEIGYNDDMQMVWEEHYTLKDMEWETTDGQITAFSLEDFFTGNNLLKKAVVTEPGYGETGTITAEYAPNGDYSYTFGYFEEGETEVVESDVFTHRTTDEYGSYTETTHYYEGEPSEDALVESQELVVTCNEHRDVVKEEYYFDGELDGGMEYAYTYNEQGLPIEFVMNEYSYEDEAYLPMMKLVYKDYTDVTTGIREGVTTGANGRKAVYNLQGIRMNDTDNLPAGVYVIRQGNQTTKVIRK